ncbi:MAG TPA: CHAT domain-containing protein, partial [Candidatus Omnitrophica bacterium]|nr:CHAT domain-containing protein [Candidatus Omnitrophota bacterium]
FEAVEDEWEDEWPGTYFPIYIYWVPYIRWGKITVGEDVLYAFFGFSKWASEEPSFDSDAYLRSGIGFSHCFPLLGVGAEVGYTYYKESYWEWSASSIYFGLTITLGGGWFGIGVEEIPSPSVQVIAHFTDTDGNQILSGNEEGKLSISIPNSGKGKAKGVILNINIPAKEFKDRISYTHLKPVGNIKPYGRREITIPIKAKGELPKGKFTVEITCSYKTEWGEKQSETGQITIKTAPSTGMIRVAFENLSSEGLPSWIIPTPLQHADYQVKYARDRVTILNLNTADRRSQTVSSVSAAKNFVKKFFQSWDTEPPRIVLSSSGGIVRARDLRLSVRLSDDRKLDEMRVYLNDKIHKTESFAERTETERDLSIPLKMGDNEIRITLTDWVGKRDEKTVIFTRIRGGTGTHVAGKLPRGAPPPGLSVVASPLDGNNIIAGGREEGVRVTVTNRGKGTAKWVRVILEGDDYLIERWGRERNLEDIRPGETKTAEFKLSMPTELPRRTAQIQVSVKEGRGYSPTVRPTMTFSLIPAEVEERPVEVVEDVVHDIPEGKTKRRHGYALVIGLSRYQNVVAPKYARKDAETFKKYLSKVFGISHIEELLDEQATIGAIRGELIDWMKEHRGFKVIYFAGHGVPDPKNPREGDVYLLPYDGNPERRSTLMSIKDISELGAENGDTVILFLDACFSGSEGRTVQIASRPLVVARIKETNAITFAAAEGSQPSKEFEKAKHGYFTYYTLLGLKGKADANGDGWITTTELYNFVRAKVADATNNIQIPVLRPEREIRIGRIR